MYEILRTNTVDVLSIPGARYEGTGRTKPQILRSYNVIFYYLMYGLGPRDAASTTT